MNPQLCLGTAQFGMPYGITNKAGQVPEAEVAKLLAQLDGASIRWLDTAQVYGNSEEVLGRNLPKKHHFRVISKLPPQPQAAFTADDAVIWEQAFRLSCERLGVESLDALLLHAPTDLSKPGGAYLEDWLIGLRQRGLVERLGISIYAAEDLEGVSSALLDLVQLPLSLFDQRLLQDGTIALLHSRGSAVHARSLYLQGLLLTPATQWPPWVSPEVRAHQQAFEAQAEQWGCRLIDLALGFAKEQLDLEAVVLGVCSCQELAELRQAWEISPWLASNWRPWAIQDPGILDPRRWPR